MTNRLLPAIVASVMLFGCARAGGTPGATPQASTQPRPGGQVTISGLVADVAPDAGMIVMAEMINGVALVVLDADGAVFGPEGDRLALAHVRPGQAFTAVGAIVSSDSLLADTIRLHGDDVTEATAEPTEVRPATATVAPSDSEPTSGSQAISLERPSFGQAIASPVEVRGSIAHVPAGRTVRVRVFDSQGQLIGESTLRVSGEPGQAGAFAGHVPFDAPAVGGGTVEVADGSPANASPASVRVQVGFDGTPSIVLSGRVGAFYTDPPLIVLEEPVHGFSAVRLSGETRLSFLNGGAATLEDIWAGKAIWASGFGGDSGTLVAHEVVLIEEGVARPTPETEAIEIVSPGEGELVANPIELRGSVSATPFEGTLVVRLWDSDGELIAEHPFIVDGAMGEPATFVAQIEYRVQEELPARLEVVEISPRDGSISASAEVGIVLAAAPDTVIVGRVASVFVSARIIDLGEPVAGFELVALDESTVILSASGEEIGLADLRTDMEIEISGWPGVPGTLIASVIRVLA